MLSNGRIADMFGNWVTLTNMEGGVEKQELLLVQQCNVQVQRWSCILKSLCSYFALKINQSVTTSLLNINIQSTSPEPASQALDQRIEGDAHS